MDVSENLCILIFLKSPSTKTLKNKPPGDSIKDNTVVSKIYKVNFKIF